MKTILLAEDNGEIRKFFTRLIRKTPDVSVEVVENGQELIDMLSITSFDLVVSDVLMPKINGDDALLKSKNLGDTPVVIFTALESCDADERIDRLRGEGVNVICCLQKPVEYKKLREVIGGICGRR